MNTTKNFVAAGAVLAFATVLGGCATAPGAANAIDCATSDWGAYGEKDARDGAPVMRRDTVAATCPGADIAAYDAGYTRGLNAFCQPASGYTYALEGKPYAFNCPDELEPGFVRAYQVGYEEFELKQAVREADRELNRTDRRLRDLDNEVKRQEQMFYNSTNRTSSEQARVQTEVGRLQRRLVQLQQDRLIQRNTLDAAQMALKKFREARPDIPGID
ncbi:MAG: DUF2799 domain-containing protein [Pseudomonadota bacterium]